MQQTDVREGVGLKLKKGDANGDNSLRFNVVNSRLKEDTALYKRNLKDYGCVNYVAHMFGDFQFRKTLPLYSLFLNALIKSLSIYFI